MNINDYIRDRYPTTTSTEIGRALGMTRGAVTKRAQGMGVRKASGRGSGSAEASLRAQAMAPPKPSGWHPETVRWAQHNAAPVGQRRPMSREADLICEMLRRPDGMAKGLGA